MLRRCLHVSLSPFSLLLVLLSLLPTPALSEAAAPLVLEGIGNATAPVGGHWQFHTGDELAWATQDLDDSAWETISVDNSWGAQSHFGYTGYAWYRRNISISPVAGANAGLSIFLPPIDDAYELYWNGKLVGKSGKLPPAPVWYFNAPYRSFRLDGSRSGVLALRVWKAPYLSYDSGVLGGLTAPPLVGSDEAIRGHVESLDHRWLRGRQYDFALDLLYALVTLLSFLAWLRNRQQKILFWMTIYCLAPLLAQSLIAFRLPFHLQFALGLLQPIISIEDLSLWFLLLYVLRLDGDPRLRRWTRILAIVGFTAGVLDGLLTFMPFDSAALPMIQIADGLFTATVAVVEVYPLVLIGFALRKRLDTSRWLVAIFASLRDLIVVLRTALEQGERYTHWTIGERISRPLFVVNGNRFTALTLVSTCLFLVIVYAVYRYSVYQGKRQVALEQEFKSAQELQRVLIPDTLPEVDGYSITSAYRPAEEVGGDFFQLIPLNAASTLLMVGDVSGKGLKAAMTVSLIVGTARTLAESTADPAEMLSGLNRRLYGRLDSGFVSCCVLRLGADGACVVANAGHPSPFLNQQELNLPGTLPLGLVPSATFEETTLQLEVGDRLTLYTDGMLEARSPSGELYGFDRLAALLATRPEAEEATQAAVAFGQQDDVTVLTLTRLAIGVKSSTLLMAPELVAAAT